MDTQDTGQRQRNTRHSTKTKKHKTQDKDKQTQDTGQRQRNTITQHTKLKRWTTENKCKDIYKSVHFVLCSYSKQGIILSFFISSHFLHFIQRKTNVNK